MNLQTLPDGQLTQRFKLAREAAEKLGHARSVREGSAGGHFLAGVELPAGSTLHPKHSRTFTNAQGQQQGTCIHLGRCDIGCDVRAKNTLDLNYIPLAEQHGAEVRPLHIVRSIERSDGGYRVVFDRIERGRLVRGAETATRVLPAAGSLGSTELLLRCRDEAATLPRLSRMLGQHWSANGNFLSMAVYSRRGPSSADSSGRRLPARWISWTGASGTAAVRDRGRRHSRIRCSIHCGHASRRRARPGAGTIAAGSRSRSTCAPRVRTCAT